MQQILLCQTDKQSASHDIPALQGERIVTEFTGERIVTFMWSIAKISFCLSQANVLLWTNLLCLDLCLVGNLFSAAIFSTQTQLSGEHAFCSLGEVSMTMLLLFTRPSRVARAPASMPNEKCAVAS